MKKYLKYILLFLVLIISFFIFSFSINHGKQNKTYTPKVETIKEEKVTVQSLREKYGNNDIVGTISIPNTEINEVVMQKDDNRYYLTHDNYGNYDIYGSVFLDHRNNKDSKKILIFGHNDYKDETPFSDLENYYDKSYYNDHQYIDVMLDDEEFKYQIFSVYIEPEDFTYMNLKIDDTQYSNDLIMYKNKSFYDTKVDVSPTDKILILQTCSNHKDYKKYENKYLLIIGKQINS